MEISAEYPMSLSRLANRLFANYCIERAAMTELTGYYMNAWLFIEKLIDAEKGR